MFAVGQMKNIFSTIIKTRPSTKYTTGTTIGICRHSGVDVIHDFNIQWFFNVFEISDKYGRLKLSFARRNSLLHNYLSNFSLKNC